MANPCIPSSATPQFAQTFLQALLKSGARIDEFIPPETFAKLSTRANCGVVCYSEARLSG